MCKRAACEALDTCERAQEKANNTAPDALGHCRHTLLLATFITFAPPTFALKETKHQNLLLACREVEVNLLSIYHRFHPLSHFCFFVFN